MPRDPKDISVTSDERIQRRIAEAQDIGEPAYRRSGSGASGAEGKEGKAGAVWYSGTTVPSTALGVVGDFYLRTTTSDVYKKTGEVAWSLEVNLKGAPGAPGSTGATGEEGASQWSPVVTTGVNRLSASSFEKVSGEAAEGQLYSLEGYRQGCFASWVPQTTNKGFGLGLNTDPTTDAGFTGIDYWLNCTTSGTLLIRENGVEIGTFGSYVAGDVLAITYDGFTVRYWKNGVQLREITRAVGEPLFLDSWWSTIGGKVTNVHFGPLGQRGESGATGPSGTGAPIAARLATAAALPAYTRTTNKLEANAVGTLANIDGVAAAVNDLILLKNGAAGADNGVYKVTKLGGAAEKWVMERYESMDTSAEAIPGMLVTVAAGTKNHDEVYQLTTDSPITLNTTSLTFARTAPRDFGLVAALPTSEAIEGDVCTYKAVTGEILWQCIYDGVGEYPWKVIGGAPMRAESNVERSLNNITAYSSLPTDPLKITAPLKGIYDISIEARARATASARFGYMSYAVGATAANDNWSIQGYGGTTDFSEDLSKTTQQTVAASAVIEEKARTGGAFEFFWLNRRLRAMPIRVA